MLADAFVLAETGLDLPNLLRENDGILEPRPPVTDEAGVDGGRDGSNV